MSSSPEVKGFNSKAKEAEYQALWQTCDRALRKGDYIYADRETKRNMLYAACRFRLEKRRTQGKAMCGTSIVSMVDLHLQREVNSRLFHEARMVQAQNPAPNPAPNPVPFLAEPQHYNINPVPFNPAPFNPAQNPYLAVPQHQHLPQVPMAPAGFDMPMYNEDPVARALQAQLNTQSNYIERLINTLRDYHGRIVLLEARVQEEEQARRTAAFVQPAHPIHHAVQYPMEGLNGGGFDFPVPRPMTPGSQTQDGDEDDQVGGVPLMEA